MWEDDGIVYPQSNLGSDELCASSRGKTGGASVIQNDWA